MMNYILLPVYQNPKMFRNLADSILRNDLSAISGIVISQDLPREWTEETTKEDVELRFEISAFRKRLEEEHKHLLIVCYEEYYGNKGVDGNAELLWKIAFNQYKADNALLIEQDSILSRDAIAGVFRHWTMLSYEEQGFALCLFCQSDNPDPLHYARKQHVLCRSSWFSSHCVAFTRKRYVNTVQHIWKKSHGAWDETMQLYCDVDGLHTVVPYQSRVLVPFNEISEKTTKELWEKYYKNVRSCESAYLSEDYKLEESMHDEPLYGKGSELRFWKGIEPKLRQKHFMELIK